MARYAPADSLLYIEANEPLEVLAALGRTEAWQAFAHLSPSSSQAPRNTLVQTFLRWTGIGPVQSVILARAQVAAVVTDLGAIEEGETLRIRQEEAILVETHTSEVRIRGAFEEALKTLAEKFYGQPTLKQVNIDGLEFSEWTSPDGGRQVVGVVAGSLVIVGNSEHAVARCLAVSQGKRQSLLADPDLGKMRLQVGAAHALTFGYVPAANSARLLAIGLPILLGRAPGDSEFQRLITAGAAKIFGTVAWSSGPYLTGIEDRYLVTLQPAVATRLKADFAASNSGTPMQKVLPVEVYSATAYQFSNPGAAWQGLKGAVSSQVDALSTIAFATLLKSSLLSYGIEDPDAFLTAVGDELFTIRLDENSDRSLLVAGVRNRAVLQKSIVPKSGPNTKASRLDEQEIFSEPAGEFAAAFIDDLIVLGNPSDVRRYASARQQGSQLSAERLRQMNTFRSSNTAASAITYTDDSSRVRNFLAAVVATRSGPAVPEAALAHAISQLPFAVTETTLNEHGLERTTRSPLGQFSTLLPLLAPEQPAPVPNKPVPR
jgi:hypothetical protein